jgi:hypothetical protein
VVIEDKNGYKWVIDDRYLAMMKDMMQRIKKWLAVDD